MYQLDIVELCDMLSINLEIKPVKISHNLDGILSLLEPGIQNVVNGLI